MMRAYFLKVLCVFRHNASVLRRLLRLLGISRFRAGSAFPGGGPGHYMYRAFAVYRRFFVLSAWLPILLLWRDAL
jgi:hypothetical protein